MSFVPLEVFSNLSQGTVSAGGTSAPASGTVETWTVTVLAAFPAAEYGAQQFHIADTSLPSEQITVLSCPGGTGSQSWTVQRGAENSTVVTHAGGFTIVQVVSSGTLATLQYAPWEFPVAAYGAQGDGKIGTGGTGTAGSATFTDSGATFVNAAAPLGDVGKVIVINQGTSGSGTNTGTVQNPFCGTIAAVNSATSVTLNTTLAAPCTNAPYIYGTDDAVAINTAISAAQAFALAHNYKAQVLFGPLNYMLGVLIQTTTPNNYNTHITIPIGAQFGAKLCIDLIGVGDASEPDYWESTIPNLQGTCLVSAVFGTGQPNVTYGSQSVVGGPTGTAGLSPGGFANTLLTITGITAVCPWNSQQWGFDFTLLGQVNADGVAYLAFAPVNFSQQVIGGPYLNVSNIVTNGKSVGIQFPKNLNNNLCNAQRVTAEGSYFGVQFAEHFDASKLTALYCSGGVSILSTGRSHGATIRQFSCEDCNYAVTAENATGGPFPINISMMDTEILNTAHVNDPNSYLTGVIWHNSLDSVHPVLIGGTGLAVYDIHIPAGPWTGPAAPASTVAQQNVAFRDATVYCSAATSITGTSVGPASGSQTALGQTAGAGVVIPVRVPSGHWFSVTYTGALTTKWVLE